MKTQYTLVCKDKNSKVKHVFTNVHSCDDIVRQFVYFLQGCSFHQYNIISSLQYIAHEIDSNRGEPNKDE